MKKKKIIKIFNLFKIFLFKLIYGKIKKIISTKKTKNIFVKKVFFEDSISYNLFNIPYGRLYSNTIHDTAFILNKSLIKEASFQYRYKKNEQIINGNIHENTVIKNGTPKFIKKIKGTVFSLLSGGAAKNSYWHWVFDVLPKVGILEKSNFKHKLDYYLLPSMSKNYQKQSFLNLGISFTKLLNGEKFKHIICDNLLASDHPVVFNNDPSKSMVNIPIWIIKWLRKKFLKTNLLNTKLPKKIFINREHDSSLENRKIINNNEVKYFLTKLGFKSITLSNYDFKKQVEIFKNAKFVIGLHGSGFANIVFSKPGTKILEIQSTKSGNVISNLAKKCKLNYKKIIEKNTSRTLNYQNSHIIVNLSKLKKLILSYK